MRTPIVLITLAYCSNLIYGLGVRGLDDNLQIIQAYLDDQPTEVTDQTAEVSDHQANALDQTTELPFPTDGSVELNRDQVHQHLTVSKTKNLTITCPELHNTTFTNDPPFDVLGIPECAAQVQPQIMLYLPKMKGQNATSCSLISANLPNTNTTTCWQSLNARKDVKKLVILIHGFLNSFATVWLHEMQADIQKVDQGTAVMIVGWGRGLEDIFSYWRAAGNTRYISHALYLLLLEMHSVMDHKIFVHCAGHSLGGQVCGLTGKQLIAKDSDKMKFDRISGMDPAGPLFCEDVPCPFNYHFINSSARLGPQDAHFVDVIHTDGDARYLDYIPQYGTIMQLGTVDFYPGTGSYYGCYQPGCLNVIDLVSCSHSRAHYLYTASLVNAVCLASRVCHGDPHHIPKNCQPLSNAIDRFEINMGYWAKPEITGMYTVEVIGKVPYCAPMPNPK